MDFTADQMALAWIAYARQSPNEASGEIFARGWLMLDMVEDDPELAWEAIKAVVGRYPDVALFSDGNPEARRVVGNLAAGPLEELLDRHGPRFIEVIEREARVDRRMAWTLGGVWQSSMSNDIWMRVQRAAGDNPYWRE
jgi:hypothetical protein